MVLLARSRGRVESVISKIRQSDANIKVDFVPVSLDDLETVRSAAATINGAVSRIHCLINNAGIMNVEKYTLSKQGHELQFAVNHLGHFLLTNLLLPKIIAAGPGARIVNLTSDGYDLSPVRLDDYNFTQGSAYDGWSGYGQSKSANILFTKFLASRLAARGIQSYAVHPGIIFTTSLASHIEDVNASLAEIDAVAVKNTGEKHDQSYATVKPVEQGIATTLIASLDPTIAAQTGGYMANGAVRETRSFVNDMGDAEQLWVLSEQLVGERFEL